MGRLMVRLKYVYISGNFDFTRIPYLRKKINIVIRGSQKCWKLCQRVRDMNFNFLLFFFFNPPAVPCSDSFHKMPSRPIPYVT